MSGELIKKMKLEPHYNITGLGENMLREKLETMDLYTVKNKCLKMPISWSVIPWQISNT